MDFGLLTPFNYFDRRTFIIVLKMYTLKQYIRHFYNHGERKKYMGKKESIWECSLWLISRKKNHPCLFSNAISHFKIYTRIVLRRVKALVCVYFAIHILKSFSVSAGLEFQMFTCTANTVSIYITIFSSKFCI